MTARPHTVFPPIAVSAVVLAVVSTVVLLPDGLSRWFLPKAAVLAIAALLAALAPGYGRLPRWFVGLVGASVLVLAAATLVSDAPAAQFWGRFPRYEGAVMLSVYLGAAWLGARMLGPASGDRAILSLQRASAGVALAVGVISMLESFGLRPISSGVERPGSLLGNASDQGLVGVALLAILALPTLRAVRPPVVAEPPRARSGRPVPASPVVRVHPAYLGAGLAAAIATIVLSASRGAVAAAVVVLIVIGAAEIARVGRLRADGAGHGRTRPIAVLLASVAALAVAVLAVPYTRERMLGSGARAAETITDRLLIWRESLDLIAQRPLLGWGPSGFMDAVSAAHGRQWQDTVGSEMVLDSPHNWLVQVVIAGGALLLVVVITIVVAVTVAGLARWRAALAEPTGAAHADLLVGAAATLAALAVGWAAHFPTPSTMILAAMMLGALVARPPRPLPLAAGARLPALVGVAAWALALVLAAGAELPMNAAVAAARNGDVAAAQSSFELATRLRPWDADVESIAAQTMADAADARVPAAAPLAVAWARTALERIPSSLSTAKALAVGQQYSGDLVSAERTLATLARSHRFDSQVAHRLGGVLVLQGRLGEAGAELARAADLDPDSAAIAETLAYVDALLGARADN